MIEGTCLLPILCSCKTKLLRCMVHTVPWSFSSPATVAGELLFILQNPIHIFSPPHAAATLRKVTTLDQRHTARPEGVAHSRQKWRVLWWIKGWRKTHTPAHLSPFIAQCWSSPSLCKKTSCCHKPSLRAESQNF